VCIVTLPLYSTLNFANFSLVVGTCNVCE
jgi:hypothetical protein